ncbi:MAG: hypothetical protein RL154_1053 [Pseudomonadota bacterium]|jgi:hypothetical protein
MKIRPAHAPYISNKIAIDLLNSGLVTMKCGIDPVKQMCLDILDADLDLELAVDEKARLMLDQNEEEISFVSADRRNLFGRIKRRISEEMGLILDQEERFSSIAHKMMDAIWEENLVDFNANEIRIKTIIVRSILEFMKNQEGLEKLIEEKVANYKRALVPGSEEYEIVTQKLYEEELKKRGIF